MLQFVFLTLYLISLWFSITIYPLGSHLQIMKYDYQNKRRPNLHTLLLFGLYIHWYILQLMLTLSNFCRKLCHVNDDTISFAWSVSGPYRYLLLLLLGRHNSSMFLSSNVKLFIPICDTFLHLFSTLMITKLWNSWVIWKQDTPLNKL